MVFSYPARIDFSKPPSSEVAAAVAVQKELRGRVRLEDDFGTIRTIAGVDSGYDLERNLTKAVIAILDWDTLTLQTSVIAYAPTDFPYISGLLSFREIPAIIKALECLKNKPDFLMPDLLMVDGQGVSHPRRLGIAAHLGVMTGLPAIGVAKSRLIGKYDPLPTQKFTTAPLMDKGEQIGTVLRSKQGCNPLFISAGHKVSQKTALDITLHCLSEYRLPEPTRIADHISKWKLPSDTKNLPPGEAEDLFEPKNQEAFRNSLKQQ